MSPRHKSHRSTSSSSSASSSPSAPRDTPITATPPKDTPANPLKTSTNIPPTTTISATSTITTTLSHVSNNNQSSVPVLPDVHNGKATSGGGLPVGNFLSTLLDEEQRKVREEEEKENDAGRFQENGGSTTSRSVAVGRRGQSKTKGKAVREGHRLNLLQERSERLSSGETLTARSDGILTASWAEDGSGGDMSDSSHRKGQRRRHSKDIAATSSSSRRLSGSLPSKKKFKAKLSMGSNSPRLSVDLMTKSLSRRSPVQNEFTKTERAPLAFEKQVDIAVEEEKEEDYISDSVGNNLRSENCAESTVITKEASDSDPEYLGVDSSRVPQPATTGLRASLETARSREGTDKNSNNEETSIATTEVITKEIQQNSHPKGSERVFERDTTSSSPTQAPDSFSQWTTCRALESTNDDDDDDDDDDDFEDNDDDALGCSRTSEELHNLDGRLSRLTSGNHARRKRPLLLPPIMLPPIYSVKPTPLIFRDDVYFATSGANSRRPVTKDEWDKLRDCRYLRIRTMRRHLKV